MDFDAEQRQRLAAAMSRLRSLLAPARSGGCFGAPEPNRAGGVWQEPPGRGALTSQAGPLEDASPDGAAPAGDSDSPPPPADPASPPPAQMTDRTDAAGLPSDPRIGQTAVDAQGVAEHYLGLNGDGTRVWAGAGQATDDPDAPAGLDGLVVTAPRRDGPAPASPSTPSGDVHVRQREALKQILIGAEGSISSVYRDSLRIPTVGIGHRVLPSDGLKVGDQPGDARIEQFFEHDSANALDAARRQAAAAGIADPDFVAPLASVNFQLGSGWTKKFPKTWALIQKGDYAAAADELGRSKWYRQTPKRVVAFQNALRALPRPSTSPQPPS